MSAELTVAYDKSSPKSLLYGYALKVTVTNAVGMPAEIFMYQRGAAPAPSAGETVKDTFIGIADPVDLEELPVSAPDIGNEIPYYRLNTVTLVFRSNTELETTKTDIAGDIAVLVQTMNALEDFALTATETVTYD